MLYLSIMLNIEEKKIKKKKTQSNFCFLISIENAYSQQCNSDKHLAHNVGTDKGLFSFLRARNFSKLSRLLGAECLTKVCSPDGRCFHVGKY